MFVALSALGCGGSVQHASVGPTAPAPLRAVSSAPTELALDPGRSEVEVAGSDRLTGEHVAVIRSLEARLSGVSEARVDEVVIVADLRTLRMASQMVEDFVKSSDFLDVERYPLAVFRSRDVRHDEGERYTARGVLELHGVAREIEFVAHVTRARDGATLRADFLLPRQAFQIRRRDGWDFLINDDFRVKVRLATKRPRASLARGVFFPE